MSEIGTDTATLEANLAEARRALHKLLTGAQTVKATYLDVGSVDYQPTDESRLRAYIRELEAALGLSVTPRRRAAWPLF